MQKLNSNETFKSPAYCIVLYGIVHIYLPFTRKRIVLGRLRIFWMGRLHSLGSCHFRSVWTTCLPHEGGGVSLSALPKDTTIELAGLFSTTSSKCRAPSWKAVDTIF